MPRILDTAQITATFVKVNVLHEVDGVPSAL